jgi:hypothetical protein
MNRVVNMRGQIFGRLKVLHRAGSEKHSKNNKIRTFALWLCKCACGKKITTRGTNLRSGVTKSCGCLIRELTSARLILQNTIHGMARTSEYMAYQHAKRRCTNPKDRGWKDYGGRGIQFLLPSFPEFIARIGRRPSSKHSLDRPDNDGNYTLINIRWATKKEQMQNRREYATIKRICCAECGSIKFKRIEAK